MESVAQGIRKNCPWDYACIIDALKSAEATSGNIAFIVQLLKNISTDLSDNVTREKMKVGILCESHEKTDPFLFSKSCVFQQFQMYFEKVTTTTAIITTMTGISFQLCILIHSSLWKL